MAYDSDAVKEISSWVVTWALPAEIAAVLLITETGARSLYVRSADFESLLPFALLWAGDFNQPGAYTHTGKGWNESPPFKLLTF